MAVMGKSPMRPSGFEQISTFSSCMSPMHESGFEQTSTVSSAITRVKDSVDGNASFCVPRRKVVCELDISDLNPRVCSQNSAGELDYGNLTMCKRVETAPVRHVSFAETVEVGEFEVMQAENNVGETNPQKHIVESIDQEEFYVKSIDQEELYWESINQEEMNWLRDALLTEEFELDNDEDGRRERKKEKSESNKNKTS